MIQINMQRAAINSRRNMARHGDPILKLWSPRRASQFAPLGLMSLALTHLMDAIRRNHPDLLERMGSGASAIFLIDPVDLPVVFRIQPMTSGIAECCSRSAPCVWDARVAGPIKTLLGMIHGNLDGDALFFSRDISIEGDTEAILALRNAIDAAEIDLVSEFAGLFGPFRPLVARSASTVISIAERLTGNKSLRQAT